jgi:hypothetical protein
LAEAVARAIDSADPIGVLATGAPDEYAPEIKTILPRLSGASELDDVVDILHEEFSRWFGVDTAGPRLVYEPAASRIWHAVEEYRHADHAMTMDQAIAQAEAILPGSAAAEGDIDPRWQAIIAVGEFIEDDPEPIWRFVRRWGSTEDEDLRMAIATCLLEHLLEHHFDRFISRVEEAAHGNPLFARTVQSCWNFGQSEEPTRAARLDRLKASLDGKRQAQSIKGRIVIQNLRKQFRRGDPIAATNIAATYRELGNTRRAFQWWRRASGSDGDAWLEVGYCLQYGIGTRRNVAAAITAYRRTIASDHTTEYACEEAQYHLAIALVDRGGLGSRREVERLLTAAAGDGDYPQAAALLSQLRGQQPLRMCRCRRGLARRLGGKARCPLHRDSRK